MRPIATRREFLGATGIAVGAAGLAGALEVPPAEPTGRRMKIAALTSVYHYLSHAYHIVGRFLDGFVVHDGQGLHKPDFEIASLFIEQVADATDLGRAKAARHNVRLSPSIADALTLGTGKLAVDGVLLIAEHGDYPYNDKLQKLYPRGRFFGEAAESGGAVMLMGGNFSGSNATVRYNLSDNDAFAANGVFTLSSGLLPRSKSVCGF